MGRVRRRLAEGQRLAYALRQLATGRRRRSRGWLRPPGPTVRVVCECGRRLHVGTGTGPAGWDASGAAVFTWTCDRCGTSWTVPAMDVVAAWAHARDGDRTVRLPLA